jgi:hypothetical protein
MILIVDGAIPPLPYMPLWHIYVQLYGLAVTEGKVTKNKSEM